MKPIINYLRRQQAPYVVSARAVEFVASAIVFVGAISIANIGTNIANSAEHEELGDIAARLQFDYFAADDRGLRRDLQALKQLEAPETNATLRHYYLAYGNMKLVELLSEKDKSTAKKAASECKDQAESVSVSDTKRLSARERVRVETLAVELAAIHASCDGSVKALEKAASLATNNPRVQLLLAVEKAKHAKMPAEFADAHARLIAVAELFDTRAAQISQPELDMPDWGQAEALAWLGQSHMQQSNKIAARNTLERALVLAPDYAWARALQTQLRKER